MGTLTTRDGTTIYFKAFSESDFTNDLKAFDVPMLVLHGDDDTPAVRTASARRRRIA